MRLNKNTVIDGLNVKLVSYKKEHVPKYHQWMSDPELRELTASEPLTLEEEFKMQQKWINDLDKCTYIILEKAVYDATGDEVAAMIGDVNLFFNDPENKYVAECEIMIAEPSARGKGRGSEALCLMFGYGVDALGVEIFQAKIGMNNERSIHLFKKFGFKEISRSDVFKEITYTRPVDERWIKWLKEQTPVYRITMK